MASDDSLDLPSLILFAGRRADDAQSAYVSAGRVTSPQTAPATESNYSQQCFDDRAYRGGGHLASPTVTPARNTSIRSNSSVIYVIYDLISNE